MARLQKSDIQAIVKEVTYPNYEIYVTDRESDGTLYVGAHHSVYDPETGNTTRSETATWLLWPTIQQSQLLQVIFNCIKYHEEQLVYHKFKYKDEPIFNRPAY